MAAEATSETSVQVLPNVGKKVVFITATTAAGNDYVTINSTNFPTTPLTVVESVWGGYATDGTAMTFTITGTTNVVTITSAAKTYNFIVCGY
jgi:hypothetical protein